MSLSSITQHLGYTKNPENWVTHTSATKRFLHLWPTLDDGRAHDFGSYVFQASPSSDRILEPRPAIHVVRADSDVEAREIRRKLWNVGSAPFLMIILPNRVKVYKGFDYTDDEQKDLIVDSSLEIEQICKNLKDFSASEIDSGRIWVTQATNIQPERRVDQRLLKSLEELGDALVSNYQITRPVAHSIIGKYIYIYYLHERNILSNAWLEENGINLDEVLSRKTSSKTLQKLIQLLDSRFNGGLFPFDFKELGHKGDEIVRFTASIFKGDQVSGQQTLDFKFYDFSCIPVEMLSSIYEQFLQAEGKGKKEGAVYTREFVADYLLSEINSVKPLENGMRILDPACGSGVFLVLVYRRLIELEMHRLNRQNLSLLQLSTILQDSIFGVEVIVDACYVTEFSLILMLLSYADPEELEAAKYFRLPHLHNKNIFHADFFNEDEGIWPIGLKFDWIVGNPPWTKLNKETTAKEQKYAWKWIQENSSNHPVGRNSLSEAFTWRIQPALKPNGCAGLLVYATSLFNTYSLKYRKRFFAFNEVRRITNFTNLAYILFDGRVSAPAATLIYSPVKPGVEKKPIIHYGPFAINQILNKGKRDKKKSWTITIYEDEIKSVDHYDAETGEPLTWKIALWGSYRDENAIARFKKMFPLTLDSLIKDRKWKLHQASGVYTEFSPKYKPLSDLPTFTRLNANSMSGKFFLTVPDECLYQIQDGTPLYYQGRRKGLEVAVAPHMYWGPTFAAYSDNDFILPKSQVGLSVPQSDADYLRAVSAYLNSSIGRYLLFFHCTSWGIDRSIFSPKEALSVPMPKLSEDQVMQLAELHKDLSMFEINTRAGLLFSEKDLEINLKDKLDEGVQRILRVPSFLCVLAQDFIRIRYQLIKGNTIAPASQPADNDSLYKYAIYLRDSLNAFAGTSFKVKIIKDSQFVTCVVSITRSEHEIEPIVDSTTRVSAWSTKLWQSLKQPISQWFYVQKGLRILSGKDYYICKRPRLIDWSKSQALLDSDEIIAEVLSYNGTVV